MPWFLRKIDFDINILIEILKFFKENAKVIEINKLELNKDAGIHLGGWSIKIKQIFFKVLKWNYTIDYSLYSKGKTIQIHVL